MSCKPRTPSAPGILSCQRTMSFQWSADAAWCALMGDLDAESCGITSEYQVLSHPWDAVSAWESLMKDLDIDDDPQASFYTGEFQVTRAFYMQKCGGVWVFRFVTSFTWLHPPFYGGVYHYRMETVIFVLHTGSSPV